MRVAVFEWLRVLATVVVIYHHSALAYYGSPMRRWYVLDPDGTIAFEALLRIVDPFQMPAFFLIAGWLTARTLHRGRAGFVQRRLLRLGLPFLVGSYTLVPLLMYLKRTTQSGLQDRFTDYWLGAYLTHDYRAGYLWFLSMLLVFQLAAWSLHRARPRSFEPAPRPPSVALAAALVAVVAGGEALAQAYFGEYAWVEWGGTGLLTYQPSRLASYAAAFWVGAEAWRGGWTFREGLFARPGLALLGVALALGVQVAFGLTLYPAVSGSGLLMLVNGALYAGTSLVTVVAGVAVAGRLADRLGQPGLLRRLSGASYTTYLIHLPVVVSLQYVLLYAPANPVLKALAVLLVSAPLSFALADLLLRVRWLRRVLG